MIELNNIYRVGLLEVSNLKSYRRKEEREVDISFVGELHYLQHLMTPAALSVTEKVEDGCRTYASKLALKTCEDIDCSKRYVFICETIFGKKIVLGSDSRPYAVITRTENHPESASDSQLTSYIIAYTSTNLPPFVRL